MKRRKVLRGLAVGGSTLTPIRFFADAFEGFAAFLIVRGSLCCSVVCCMIRDNCRLRPEKLPGSIFER
jgi:hypothetical protein